MRAPLYLSRRKAKKCVYVPAKIIEHLHSNCLEIVRFIYRCYMKKINVVLNVDNTTNKPLQISAFILAVKALPALLVLPERDIKVWQKEIETKTCLNVAVLNDSTDNIFPTNDVVLVPHRIIKRMHYLRKLRWGLFVIDDIEDVVKIGCIKKINAKFHIGITHYNFIHNPNYQLQKEILKWAKHNEKISSKHLFLSQEFWLKYKSDNEKTVDDNKLTSNDVNNINLTNKTPVNNSDKINSDTNLETPSTSNTKTTEKNDETMVKRRKTFLFDDDSNKKSNKTFTEFVNTNKEQDITLNSSVSNINEAKRCIFNDDSNKNSNKPDKVSKKIVNKNNESTSNTYKKLDIIHRTSKRKLLLEIDTDKHESLTEFVNINEEASCSNVSNCNDGKRTPVSTSSDKICAEVSLINSQILDVEEKIIEDTQFVRRTSEISNSNKNVSLHEMKPDPILDALFFNGKESDEPVETCPNEEVKESDKLLDKLFFGLNS